MLHIYKTPSLLKKISPSLVWDIPTDNKEIYLTFDDGPIPRLTEYVCDLLEKFDAKATFFCVGDNIAKHPDIFSMLLEKGHRAGNHTYNHLKAWRTMNQMYLENIRQCQSLISDKDSPSDKPLFRPPHGQITPALISKLKTEYRIVMWDVLAYDFDPAQSPEKSLDQIITKTVPGSIVVFHDNYKAEKKLKYILPRFLEHFGEKDFAFKKI